ncbi:MAG: hypothetical protein E5Y34_11070 [Mesorhizobium sp.]|uniref:hypothetical protein n=1 Tax=Mesorhizobium sp. TaxID=1871066 RepID=UPI0012137D01|nr:hypothetical protein [Mesorhizobium sp.]TIN00989.1 MAG: hypothetical protein E5Y34_11070 [Mesorhizobium sp.]
MNQIQVVSSIASKTGITLYLVSGGVLNLPNDTHKTKEIMDLVVGGLSRGEQIVTIDLALYMSEKKIEDKTGGVIRFIKQTMGQLQVMLDDLEKGIEPTIPENSLDDGSKGELAVVVTDTAGKKAIVQGVEKIRNHIEHAAKTGNVKGLQAFMERVSKVKTGHTVQELMNFMERGDLPIADDGSIVAYKVLRSTDGSSTKLPEGIFIDCHSKKVHQKLGSRVSMDAKLVDPSRRAECSSGLHIARRAYLGSFSGDIITIVKVNPEDVVAVPNGEPNKMRAAAYHIVGVLPANVHSKLRSNQAMTDDPIASKMLADVIAGNHIGIVEEVVISADGAAKITRQTTAEAAKPAPEPFKNGKAKAVEQHQEAKIDPITPKQIREQVKAAKAQADPRIPDETKAQRDARKKREKRAAQSAEKAIADQQAASAKAVKARTDIKAAPADEARFHAFGNGKVAEKILDKPADRFIGSVAENKAARDARVKREKRAKEKALAAEAAEIAALKASEKVKTVKSDVRKPALKATKLAVPAPAETKAQRDARKKREKRAAAKG